jgi:hypothetical protein
VLIIKGLRDGESKKPCPAENAQSGAAAASKAEKDNFHYTETHAFIHENC